MKEPVAVLACLGVLLCLGTAEEGGFTVGVTLLAPSESRCATPQVSSSLKSQVVLLQTAHSWANAGVLLGARMHREREGRRLLHKLNSYGIRNHTLNWINAFLTNRSHQVLVNGSHSETHIITSGVGEGGA